MSTDTDAPKDAITHFEIERALPQATLLRVRLQTGRTHQIRVHMRAIGHPVCGDREYGHKDLYGLRRQFLHAARLAFAHPVTGDEHRRQLAAARRPAGRACARRPGSRSGAARPEAAPPPHIANRAHRR